MKRQCVTSDEAVPSNGVQHKKPCSDCPWSRASLPGWLGPMTADEWLREAHGESRIECHTIEGAQCAGAAIYRTNVAKLPHNRALLLLPADREGCFKTPMEFRGHHCAIVEGGRKR